MANQANCGSLMDRESLNTLASAASGNESSKILDATTDIVTGNSLNQLGNILNDGDLTKYATAITTLTDKDNDFFKIEEQKLYKNWKNSQNEMNIKDIRAIVDLRNYLRERTQHDISFLDIVIKPSIAEDTALTTYYVDNITQDYSANINIINSISAMTTDNISEKMIVEIKKKQLYDTIANIELYEKYKNVDVRKNLYEYERTTTYSNIYNIIRIIYYVIFLIYIIFGDFIKKQMYKNTSFYIIAVIYLIFPYILKYIFASIIFIYEQIINFFTGGKKILSYDDIVRASNIKNIYTYPVPNQTTIDNIKNDYRTFILNPDNKPFIDNLNNTNI